MQFVKLPTPLLSLLAALTMPISIYLYLNIDKKGFAEVDFKDLTNAWPIFLALIAIVFLSLSGFTATLSPQLSLRLASFGVGFGCLFYVLSFTAFCLVASAVIFVIPSTYLFFAPTLFLTVTMYRLRQVQKGETQN